LRALEIMGRAISHDFNNDLASIVRDAVAGCRSESDRIGNASSTISLTLDLAQVGLIRGNERDLRQAVVELLCNAIEATTDGGEIAVRLQSSGNEVRLIVQDNGVGMTEDIVDRCFEPFFTTQIGHGRGLGLSIVHGTVRRHAGRVGIHSRPSKGTTVTVTLPMPVGNPGVDQSQSSGSPPQQLRVLVADDNRSILTVVDAFLRCEGHSVDVARDSSDALSMYRVGQYDVVLTDQSMPHLTGMQLAVAIKEASPRQPIIMMTGYDAGDVGGEAIRGVDVVLQKPLTLASLQQALAKAVSRR
jgi:CheY-like chemotaxis protein/anti-sigma regulatory factor (Ser/Thr protein kinase)